MVADFIFTMTAEDKPLASTGAGRQAREQDAERSRTRPVSASTFHLPLSDGNAPFSAGRPLVSGSCPSFATVALLTGGSDKPYALGIAAALTSAGIPVDFIGSNELDVPELRQNPRVHFLNLRGDQRTGVKLVQKIRRIIAYYLRLLHYAATSKPRIFHILWNNKFELFDRTLLVLYYKGLGKKVVFTAHNVNAGKRDGVDSFLNRLTLKIQYRLADHIFVHTRAMADELAADFKVPHRKISVIPFGINNTIPNTALTPLEAKRRLGLSNGAKAALFFGQIAPYKGLKYLVDALPELAGRHPDFSLIIAGRPKIMPGVARGGQDYWEEIQQTIARTGLGKRIVQRIGFIPDEETELFFKAADVLVLPYTDIFQSGVLFLAYNFGLPVIAADIGAFRDEIIEGKTGYVFKPKDSSAMAKALETYFSSDLFKNLETRRREIQVYANERYSWAKVAAMTARIYSEMFEN